MKHFHSRGMSLVEVVVSIGIFSVLATVGYQLYATANQLGIRATFVSQALWMAEEGIEATRSIRDQDFTALTDSTNGLVLRDDTWTFDGKQDRNGMFTRSLFIKTIDDDTKQIDSQVSWQYKGIPDSVTLSSVLTNWHKEIMPASALSIDTSDAYISDGNAGRLLTGITLSADGRDVSITTLTLSWSAGRRSLQEIRSPFRKTVFGPDRIASGTTVELNTPIDIASTDTHTIEFLFDADMSGSTFTITAELSDGSTASATLTDVPIRK